MAEYEVQWVKIGEHHIPAHKIVCPQCNKLDLGTDFRTDVTPWIATCTKGHRWEVDNRADA